MPILSYIIRLVYVVFALLGVIYAKFAKLAEKCQNLKTLVGSMLQRT